MLVVDLLFILQLCYIVRKPTHHIIDVDGADIAQ